MSDFLRTSLAQNFVPYSKHLSNVVSPQPGYLVRCTATFTPVEATHLFVTGVRLSVPLRVLLAQDVRLSDLFGKIELLCGGQSIECVDGTLNEFLTTHRALCLLHWCSNVAFLLRCLRLHKLIVDTVLSFCTIGDDSLVACLLCKTGLNATSVAATFVDCCYRFRSVVHIPICLSVSKEKPLPKPSYQTVDVVCDHIAIAGASLEVESIIGDYASDTPSVVGEERFQWQSVEQDCCFRVNCGTDCNHIIAQRFPISAIVFCLSFGDHPLNVSKIFKSLQIDWDGYGSVNVDYDACFVRRLGGRFWFVVQRDADAKLLDEQPEFSQKVLQQVDCREEDAFLHVTKSLNEQIRLQFKTFLIDTNVYLQLWTKVANVFHLLHGLAGWRYV